VERLGELANESGLIDEEALLLGAQRAARKDSSATSFLMPDVLKRYRLKREQRDRLQSFLGYQLALDRDADAVKWFAQLSAPPADPVESEWRIRSAIYHGEWVRAKQWISELPDSQRKEERWQYWLARSLEAIGSDGSRSDAEGIYRELAAKRGFFCYLAADRAKRPYQVSHAATPDNESIRDRVKEEPALRRARELHALALLPQARTEWKLLTTGMTAAELQQAAVIAHEWGWHQQAIGTLASSEFWDDMHLRYPLPYRQQVLAAAGAQKIDPSWVYAIMRSESLYAADARSAVGALGLLQLMPATAQQVGRSTGIKARTQSEILDPDNNIRLGSAYLQQMLNRFGGHHAMASAAYNAGPHRVTGWRPARSMPADIWIENIPFNETRTYVQRVMEHAVAFDWRLERDFVRLSQRLPPVPGQ
jgi:soluble lytic murein transglycosylase